MVRCDQALWGKIVVSTVEPNHTAGSPPKSNWLLPAFWMLIGITFYLGATQIKTAIVQDKHDPGPAAICLLCSVALILLGATQAVQLLLVRRTPAVPKPTEGPSVTRQNAGPRSTTRSLQQALLGVAVIGVYIYGVSQIGFGLASFAFGITSMKCFGVSWRHTLLATTACVATVYLVFIKLLGILLPTGRWDLPY